MGSRVQDAVHLTGAVIALIAFGLLILLTRPTLVANEPSPVPSAVPSTVTSFSPLPSIRITATLAPVTSTPAPASAAPTTAPPVQTTPPPTATGAPPAPTPAPSPSR
jgi:hypothetical protein